MARAHRLSVPLWTTDEERKLPLPLFASPLASLRAVLLLESLAGFRARKCFVQSISDLFFQRVLRWRPQILAAAACGRDDLADLVVLEQGVQVCAILVAQGLSSPSSLAHNACNRPSAW
jgi:hypothetical protein